MALDLGYFFFFEFFVLFSVHFIPIYFFDGAGLVFPPFFVCFDFIYLLVCVMWLRLVCVVQFFGRSSGGLPKTSEICCGIRRESQEACPAL